MWQISHALVRGLPSFLTVVPGLPALAKGRSAQRVVAIVGLTMDASKEGATVGFITQQAVASKIVGKVLQPLTRTIDQGYKRLAMPRKIGERTWISSMADTNAQGRLIKDLVIVYHDADKAGKHLDIHIGHLSFIMRVSGKPVEQEIKYNGKGQLTQASKDALVAHVRGEIEGNSRVPQNLDHSISNARYVWLAGESPIAEGEYGAGRTRQIVLEDRVEFYHHHLDSSLHLYAPALFPDQGTYLYRIYEGKSTGVPIAIWGKLIPRDENFEDRLHLKLIPEAEFETKFLGKVDVSTVTRKYDGASTYFTTTGEGFKFFSPRYSKVTGHRVEYTYKLAELAEHGYGEVRPNRTGHTQGMGEVMFWRYTPVGELAFPLAGIDYRTHRVRGPEGICWNYLSAAEMGGILNAHQVRPDDVYPEVRVYRLDRFEGIAVRNLPFQQNRDLQHLMVDRLGGYWSVVEHIEPTINRNHEGLVAVPAGLSVNEGYKVKWWGDTNDWEVTSVELGIGPKGSIAGVVRFNSLESGKEFKLGPGQLGNADDCMEMMDSPEQFVGRVAKVASRQGHEGRSAKLVEWHMDK